MEASEVLKLIDAGFTAEEIRNMTNTQQPEQLQPDPPQEQENPEPETERPADQTGDDVAALRAELEALKKTMQNQNLRQAEQPAPKKLNAGDVIKNFIENM